MEETSKEGQDRPQKATVELRSDAGSVGAKQGLDNKKWIVVGITAVVLLLLAGGGYAAFQYWQGDSGARGNLGSGAFGDLPSSGDKEPEPEAPSTYSGLSGVACERADRRAIGVMLAADPINRPVSGFAKADMVWELPVLASNVTRLLAVYQCGEPEEMGSVRSVRHDYLFVAEGVDAIVAHWGGSFHALNRISVGEFQTLNALVNPFSAFFRKNNLPAPYNGFTSYEKAWNALEQLGYRTKTEFKGYQFKDDAELSQRPEGGTLTVAWPGQFRVSYEYDKETNRYVRYWAGVKQTDPESGTGVAPSAVVIMTATNGPANPPDGGYNDVGIEGSGALEVYQDGQVIKGTWTKSELNKKDPVHFVNEAGEEIVFTRGQVWVMTPSSDIPVTWEPTVVSPE